MNRGIDEGRKARPGMGTKPLVGRIRRYPIGRERSRKKGRPHPDSNGVIKIVRKKVHLEPRGRRGAPEPETLDH